ncbi:imelysin family protein [Sphaerotilus sp.]|uniref:imelysin family protein n=1 Tax=Sphaerotilus sp. TaxID=2093942 RepID=UPI002ACE16B1|nr:imelysin family protein [Sphaerotilus sp.]MDZ7856958.1 imelysin family protein [Sphaerotilus sp.]
MQRRVVLVGMAAHAAAMPAWAQSNWRQVAVPLYGPQDFVKGFLQGHALPRARAWQAACTALVRVLDGGTGSVEEARTAWKTATLAWAALSSVATGPLVTRRSARRVDFQPVRTPLVLRAIDGAPSGEAAMDRVGSAAKGLGALEWLLWAPAAPRNDAARAFATEAARDLQREANAVAEAFAAGAEREMDDEAVVAAFGEILNQWIGGLEQLRLQRLVRPVEEARARGAKAPLALRPWAGIDAEERAARWQALQAAAVFAGQAAPPRSQGQLVPIETYLRGRGRNTLADQLNAAMGQAGRGVRGAADNRPATMARAAQQLGQAKHLAEAEVAPALEVRVGFSDADGD